MAEVEVRGELAEEEPLRAAHNALERILARVRLEGDEVTGDVEAEVAIVERSLEVLTQ